MLHTKQLTSELASGKLVATQHKLHLQVLQSKNLWVSLWSSCFPYLVLKLASSVAHLGCLVFWCRCWDQWWVQGVWPSLDLVEVYVCRNYKTPEHIIWPCVNWIWRNFHVVTASAKTTKTRELLFFFFGTSIVGKTEKVSLAKCLWMFFSFGRMNQYVLQNIQETYQICCTMAVWFTGTECDSLNCLSSQVCPPPSTLGRGGASDIYISRQCLQLQEEEINGDWQQRPGNLMFWRAFNYVYHRYTEDNKIV